MKHQKALRSILKPVLFKKLSQISGGADAQAVLINVYINGDGRIKMRLFGLTLALGTITGAIITVGPQPYFDMPALLVVIGGAAGYALLKGKRSQFISHFGAGAVYFGWVGFLIGSYCPPFMI